MMKLWHRFVILAFAMLLWTLGNASPAAEPSKESIQLAMEAAGVIAPEKEVIVRVSTDLSKLRFNNPILEGIHAKPQWSLYRLIVGFEEKGKHLLQSGQRPQGTPNFWPKDSVRVTAINPPTNPHVTPWRVSHGHQQTPMSAGHICKP